MVSRTIATAEETIANTVGDIAENELTEQTKTGESQDLNILVQQKEMIRSADS